MDYKSILVTGGAGFVGSNISVKLKERYENIHIICLDNLKRRGSELNISRLQKYGVKFLHADVRFPDDLESAGKVDLIIECSAEPSVLAGVNDSPKYLLDSNLFGAVNCLELARKQKADIVFLSTSRIYPIKELNLLEFTETATRFVLNEKQKINGASKNGISESFPLGKFRSLYGATKLAAEIMLGDYIDTYGIRGVINRFGVITGPWQMGKIDQGVIALWIARHIWKNKALSYIGFGGEGKQVRDFVHIDDVYRALELQIRSIDNYNGETYNIGGGAGNSLSLLEMTGLCGQISGNKIKIQKNIENRPNDIRIYISDHQKFTRLSGWKPEKDAEITFTEIFDWINQNKKLLEPVLNS